MKLNQEIIDFHSEEEKKNAYVLMAVQYSDNILQPSYYTLVFEPITSGIGHQIKISEESSKLNIESYKERYFNLMERDTSNKKRSFVLRDEILSSKAVGDLRRLGWSIEINPCYRGNQFII